MSSTEIESAFNELFSNNKEEMYDYTMKFLASCIKPEKDTKMYWWSSPPPKLEKEIWPWLSDLTVTISMERFTKSKK